MHYFYDFLKVSDDNFEFSIKTKSQSQIRQIISDPPESGSTTVWASKTNATVLYTGRSNGNHASPPPLKACVKILRTPVVTLLTFYVYVYSTLLAVSNVCLRCALSGSDPNTWAPYAPEKESVTRFVSFYPKESQL